MALIAITPSIVPIEERITLIERSQSTTQHYIQIQFDGVPIDTIDTIDNTAAGRFSAHTTVQDAHDGAANGRPQTLVR